MDNIYNTYDEKFEEYIFLLGQTGCGQTAFIQNIAKSKLFGKTKDVQWASKIYL